LGKSLIAEAGCVWDFFPERIRFFMLEVISNEIFGGLMFYEKDFARFIFSGGFFG
jgi:hypothetical protein